MKTWNAGEEGCPAAIDEALRRIEAAAGPARCSHRNPCGLAAYCDEGDDRQWRIADDHTSASFATADEAAEAAATWAA